MNQELQAVVMPLGSVRLEWLETTGRIDKSRELLEQELFKRFSENPDGAFLFWGSATHQCPFHPPSIFSGGSAASMPIS